MRSRNIKPGFFRNEDLAECSFEARLLFAGLWCIADREGRLEDRPKKIKMELFPADNVDCDELLEELQKHGFVVRYEVDGERYAAVVNFSKHQSPHAKETQSKIPPPGGYITRAESTPVSDMPETSTRQAPDMPETSTRHAPDMPETRPIVAPPDCLIPDCLIPDSQKKKPPSGAKKTPPSRLICDDFTVTPEMAAWFEKQGFSADMTKETEKFIDYWRGTGKKMADWVATWRNWMRRANEGSGDRRKQTPTRQVGELVL